MYRLQEIEGQFQKHVSVADVTLMSQEVDTEAVAAVYSYWVLRRRAAHNKPLLAPRTQDVDLLTRQQERADLDKMKMFVQLRQDLERVRLLVLKYLYEIYYYVPKSRSLDSLQFVRG